jgi:thioredoxin reductase
MRTVRTSAVFTFIGAIPCTEWLPVEIETDSKGFVKTGRLVSASPYWTADREPFLLETSRPGIFAAGDVRFGSTKRVASAVGEGAMAVQFVHEYLLSPSDRFRLASVRRIFCTISVSMSKPEKLWCSWVVVGRARLPP